jgi:hypothetical protein
MAELRSSRLHSHGDGDQKLNISLGETKGAAPADRQARRRNDNARFIAAPGLWLPRRDKPKVGRERSADHGGADPFAAMAMLHRTPAALTAVAAFQTSTAPRSKYNR